MIGRKRKLMKVQERGRICLDEFPRDWDQSGAEVRNGLEGSNGKIEGVVVVAGGANISNDDVDGFSVVGVGNTDAPSAVLRLLAKISVPGLVNGTDQVVVSMVVTASSGVATLIVIGTMSTSVIASASTRVVVVVAAGIGASRVVIVVVRGISIA